MRQRIIIGDQFAREFHYRSRVGEEAVVLPWKSPAWNDGRYIEETCLLVGSNPTASDTWYIRKEDAIGFIGDNAYYIGTLREEL